MGESLKPLGDAFIKLVKMIIAPVIFLTVVTGIAGMSNLGRLGRVVGKAMAYFLTFSTLALVVGLIVANLFQPGRGLNINPATLAAKDVSKVSEFVEKTHDMSVVGFLMDIIPTTVMSPLTEGNILQVLLFRCCSVSHWRQLVIKHARWLICFMNCLHRCSKWSLFL